MKKWLFFMVLVAISSPCEFHAMRSWDKWPDTLAPISNLFIGNPLIDAIDENQFDQIKKVSQQSTLTVLNEALLHVAETAQWNDEQIKELKKKVINLLLYYGANPYLKNETGKTACELVAQKDPELAQHMANARNNLVALLTYRLMQITPQLPKDIAQYIARLRYPDAQQELQELEQQSPVKRLSGNFHTIV